MLAQLIDDLTTLVQEIVMTFGAPGVAVIAFMENIFPLTPSELLYPLAGKMAYDGEASLFSVILAGGIGSIIGAFVFYHVGRYLGETRTRSFIARYGTVHLGRFRLSLFTLEAYDRAVVQFEKRGGIIVMVARWLPLIHGIISIPAGVVGMNLTKFMVYSFIGSVSWIAPTVLAGYFLGSQWERMLEILDIYEYFWYAVLAVVVLYYAVKRFRNRSTAPAPTQEG